MVEFRQQRITQMSAVSGNVPRGSASSLEPGSFNVFGALLVIVGGLAGLLVLLADSGILPSEGAARSLIVSFSLVSLALGILVHRFSLSSLIAAASLIGVTVFELMVPEKTIFGLSFSSEMSLNPLLQSGIFIGLALAALMNRQPLLSMSLLRQNMFGLITAGIFLALFWYYPSLSFMNKTQLVHIGSASVCAACLMISRIPIRLGLILSFLMMFACLVPLYLETVFDAPLLEAAVNSAAWVAVFGFGFAFIITPPRPS